MKADSLFDFNLCPECRKPSVPKIRPFCSIKHFAEERVRWIVVYDILTPVKKNRFIKYAREIIKRSVELIIGSTEYQFVEGIIDSIENNDEIRVKQSLLNSINRYDFENHFSDGRQLYYQAQLLVLFRLIETILFLNESAIERQNDSFLDLGDSNGLFMNAMEVRSGLSSNIRFECCRMIYYNGISAIQSDAQILPFKKDLVIFFASSFLNTCPI
ncbi:MAG: hypothetical protein KKC46_02400 [Proteobacteria bacterium]|nr:hypothetical protein [Pseudomonadota bacterium]